MKLLVCTECGHLFEEPHHWQERHGFDYGPFENWNGCPKCKNAAYVKAHLCDCCEEYITSDYIKTDDGKRYCESCICSMQLGDED